MKSFLFIVLFLLAPLAPAFANEAKIWQDLEVGANVSLSQAITLQTPDQTSIVLEIGDGYELEFAEPLPGLSVVLYHFRAERCENPGVETEMQMILPDGSASDKADVGVIHGKDCSLDVYVEAKDLAQPSLFRPSEGGLR